MSSHMEWKKELLQWQNVLGFSGAGSYWVFDSLDLVVGIMLSTVTVIFSVLVNYTKWRSVQNDERRKEELHQIDLKKRNDNG